MTDTSETPAQKQIRETELSDARWVYQYARSIASTICDPDNPDNPDAATVAILARAFELATPELSDRNRARIFWEEA